MGNRARLMISAGSSIRGARFFMQSRRFFKRVHLHVFALAATAVVRRQLHHVKNRRAQKFLAGTFLLHPVNDAGFGHNHKTLRGAGLAVINHLFRRTHRVGQVAHFAQAFRMHHDFCVGIFLAHPQDGVAPELNVRITIAPPQASSDGRFVPSPTRRDFHRAQTAGRGPSARR